MDILAGKSRPETALELKRLVARYWCKKRYGVNIELGLNKGGRLRADVYAMNLKGHTIVTEVKSSVSDFRTDFKYKLYSKYCHKMYLALPLSVWEKIGAEIPKGIGVMVAVPNKGGSMKVVQNSKNENPCPTIHQQMILRVAYRGSKYKGLHQLSKKAFYGQDV